MPWVSVKSRTLFAITGKSLDVSTAFTPGRASALAGVYGQDAGVGVGAAEYLAVQHPGQMDVGAVLGAARNLVPERR